MEDNAIRAIMIGVGIFVILITITTIVTYIEVAKDMATAVDKGINEWDEIDIYNIMDYNGNVTIDVSGINLMNFIRKYVNQDNIRMKLGQFTDSGDPNSYVDISTWGNDIGNVSEEKLMDINPNAKLKMTKNVLEDGTIQITVLGDIWIVKKAEEGILYGDVNLDKVLTLQDYNRLKEYLDNEYTEEEKAQADVNGDGVVDYTDYTLLNEHIVSNKEIKAGTGDVDLSGSINNNDLAYMETRTFSFIARESADINLDRVVDEEDLNNLGEVLIEMGIELPVEEE